MKIATIQTPAGRTAVVVVTDDYVVEVGSHAEGAADLPNFDRLLDVIDAGPQVWELLEEFAAALPPELDDRARGSWGWPIEDVRFQVPFVPRKDIFAVAANYHEHLVAGYARIPKPPIDPEHPEFFSKRLGALIGDRDDIILDKRATRTMDHEVELGVVMGRQGRDIHRAEALSFVFGYTVINDVSARNLNMRHAPEWTFGKSLDTFCPIGPVVVTTRDLHDVGTQRLRLRVNGVMHQDWPVGDMIFGIEEVISELSVGMTLEPGDVIAFGTGPGTGFEQLPQRWLLPDDEMETEITGIGVLHNKIRMASELSE